MDDLYDYEREYYEEPDYDTFERYQLDRDMQLGEFDIYYDGFDEVDGEDVDGDL